MENLEKYRDQDAITREEGDFLYGLIRAIKPKVCIETGTHKGYSTLRIAQALEENGCGFVCSCDIEDFGAKENFEENPDLNKRIAWHKTKASNLKLDRKIDFAFIDSAHEFENVLKEFALFEPYLSDEAVVVFHDCSGDNDAVGVNKAIEELGLNAVFIPTYNAMRVYCKTKKMELKGDQVQKRKDQFNERRD